MSGKHTMTLNIAWNESSLEPRSDEEWARAPIYKTITAVKVSRWFAANKDQHRKTFTLTHIGTGFAAAYGLLSLTAARRLALQLGRQYGKRWQFTKPEGARKLKGAKQMIQQGGAWI